MTLDPKLQNAPPAPMADDVTGRMLRSNRALSEAQEKLASKVAMLETLHAVGSALTTTQTAEELYRKVAGVLVDRMHYETGIVVGIGDDGHLEIKAATACPRATRDAVERMLRLCALPALEETYVQTRLAELMNVTSVYVTPIRRRLAEPEVAIVVGALTDGRSPRDHQEVLGALADQVGVGLENDQLYANLIREKEALEEARSELANWASKLEIRVEERTREIERRNGQLATLNALARAVNQSIDPKEMAQSVLELVLDVFGARMGAFWLVGEDSRLHLQAQHGVPQNWARRMRGGGFASLKRGGQSIPAQSSIIQDTYTNMRPEARIARRLGMGSAAVMPVTFQGAAIGAIALGFEDKSGLSEDDATVLDVFSEQVGVGITNAQLYAEARRRAERDSVTGLFNHRALQERLLTQLENRVDTGEPLSVIMFDLDNFKFFNDTYGHLCGDEVLKTVAATLTHACRAADICGRYGGDEFMLILPGANRADAMGIGERLRQSLAQTGFRPAPWEDLIPLAMSLGVSVYPEDGATRHELLASADSNLYRDKLGGGGEAAPHFPQIVQARRISGYEMLESLVATIDNKDRYTRRHSEDVAAYAHEIGVGLGLDEGALETLALAALLHDVGKIGVPDCVLRKPGKLTADEWTSVRSHPAFGALIVGAVPALLHILPAVRHHHERWDGGGYPDGLSGPEIPLMARIMAVADVVSAMTTDRPYRNALSWADTLQEIEAGLGSQFDPEVGSVFVRRMRSRLAAHPDALRAA